MHTETSSRNGSNSRKHSQHTSTLTSRVEQDETYSRSGGNKSNCRIVQLLYGGKHKYKLFT